MVLVARLFVTDPAERRASERFPVDAFGTLRDASSRPIDVTLNDLSMDGCLMEAAAELTIGGMVRLGIAGLPLLDARVVRRDDAGRYGCEFTRRLAGRDVERAGKVETVLRGPFVEIDPPAPARAAPSAPARPGPFKRAAILAERSVVTIALTLMVAYVVTASAWLRMQRRFGAPGPALH